MSPLPQEGSEEYLVHFCALFRQPARPPPRGKGLRASLGALMPRGFNPLASATAVSRLFDHHEVARRVLITGMEGAGKSTLLARALGQDEAERDGQLSYHAPVVGMPLCEVRFGPLLPRSPARMGPFGNEPPREQHCFWEYDLGGARKRRWAERALIADNDAVIWVLDAASYWDRACEIKYEIKKMLIEPDLGGGQFAPIEQPHDRPFLLLVNKHQRKTRNNVSAKELEEKYAEMLGTRTWHMADVDIISGKGVLEAFQWLSDAIEKRSSRVMMDRDSGYQTDETE